MNYKTLIDTLENIITNHLFVKTYGYGNISDISVPDNEEPADYPYVFLNPVNVSLDRQQFVVTLNMIAMTQVKDSEDKELAGQDLCINIIADIISQFTNTTDYSLFDIQTPTLITPFKERFQDDVVGATASLTIVYGKPIDGCDVPIK